MSALGEFGASIMCSMLSNLHTRAATGLPPVWHLLYPRHPIRSACRIRSRPHSLAGLGQANWKTARRSSRSGAAIGSGCNGRSPSHWNAIHRQAVDPPPSRHPLQGSITLAPAVRNGAVCRVATVDPLAIAMAAMASLGARVSRTSAAMLWPRRAARARSARCTPSGMLRAVSIAMFIISLRRCCMPCTNSHASWKRCDSVEACFCARSRRELDRHIPRIGHPLRIDRALFAPSASVWVGVLRACRSTFANHVGQTIKARTIEIQMHRQIE